MSNAEKIPQRGTVEYLEYLDAEIARLENSHKDRDYIESETRPREKKLRALQDYQLSPGALVSEKKQWDLETHRWTFYDRNKEALHTACLNGTPADIEKCIRAGESVNRHNGNGLTPLHLAVQRESNDTEAVVNMLLKHKANVNAQTVIEDDTPLHLVIRFGGKDQREDVAEKLIEYEADTQLRNRELRRPYDYAIHRGLTELAQLLAIDLPPRVALAKYKKKREEHYSRRLINAVIKGDMTDILLCIKRKANVNLQNENGAAAIHHTVTHCPIDKVNVLEVLINSGAHVNLQDHENDTALNLVIKTPTLRENDTMHLLAEKLLDWGSDHTLKDIDSNDAWALAEEKHYEDIKNLLRNRNSNYPDKLCIAVLRGGLKGVQEALCLAGINVNVKNKDGYYPIHLAVMRDGDADKEAIIDLLHNAKANINSQSEEDLMTPLHVAAKRNSTTAAKKLVDLKVDVTIKEKDGLTAHSLALRFNHQQVADIIAKSLPDPDLHKPKETKTCTIL